MTIKKIYAITQYNLKTKMNHHYTLNYDTDNIFLIHIDNKYF